MAIGTLGAVLIGGGLLGSAAINSSAASKAGKQVQAGTDAATAEQRRQFDEILRLQMPAYNRGEQAAAVYGAALGLPSMTGGGTSTTGYGNPLRVTTGDWQGYMTGNNDVLEAWRNGTFGQGLSQDQAAQLHYQQYGEAEGRTLPGAQTQTPQQSITDQVMQTPGYQAQLDQGIKSIDRAAPLVGGMYSGRRMKALNDYGQNTFGSYYNSWLDRVGGIAGQGQQTAQNIGQAGMQTAQNVGGLMVQGANARAQGTQNSANAWTGAIGTGLGMFGGAKGWF